MEIVNCSKCGTDNTTKAKYCSSCGFELPKVSINDSGNNVQFDSSSKPDNKRKYIGMIVGVIFFFITFFGTQQFFFKSGSIDKDMMNVASELNKSCPVNVDSETRLDNTIALPGKIFQYNYTLLNLDKSNADTISMKNYLEPNIINQLKTNPQMNFQREHKWTLNYLYKDKNGLFLLLIKVTPDKYAK